MQDHLSEAALANINQWLTEAKYSEYKAEVEAMISQERWQDLEDAFFKVLEFGTAGRRGVTGAGSNRINRVTIGESTQALCAYARQNDETAPSRGIVIAYDTRLSSPELSQYVARVCAANGFKTYIFEGFRATPELSFTVRHLGCAAGIVISASHNPPADNGFKAYWDDGAQVASPHDSGILDIAKSIDKIFAIPSFEDGVKSGSITIIGENVDRAYLDAVLDQAEGSERELHIVYSPLHGAGQTNVLPALREAGFTKITTVDAQMTPDGHFPTIETGKPNPEEPAANTMAAEMLLQAQADIAITNDPDADRIGVLVRHNSEAIQLTGNQSAALAVDFALSKLRQKNELRQNHYIVKTIVTTDMLSALAEKYQIKIYSNLLIGFKYIGKLIKSKEGTDEEFVIGAEESYGMLKGAYARDKDGATGALPLAEYAAELRQSGKTLVDRLFELYEELGLFVETMETAVYPGAEGFSTMQKIMASLREQPPKYIGEHEVTAMLDYQTLVRTSSQGETSQIDCIKGDVIVFECGDSRRRITVRPSGTEPKLKFYFQWHVQATNAREEYEAVKKHLSELYSSLSADALRRA